MIFFLSHASPSQRLAWQVIQICVLVADSG